MNSYRISIVSYLNTTPFIYGLERSNGLKSKMKLSLDIPAESARKLIENEVDIGLIPVASIPKVKDARIISDYGIAAEGKVHSVLLCSAVPLDQIKTIVLDYQSRTSVALCKMLCKEYWNIDVTFKNAKEGYESDIDGQTAAVIIGDRTFNLNSKVKYTYDLSGEWQKWTGLAFVFAAWVANKVIDSSFEEKFNLALEEGIQNMDKAIADRNHAIISKDRLTSYLKKDIHFVLSEEKRKGLELFLEKLKHYQ